MERERWQRIEEIYQAAAERNAGDREAFLDAACVGDEDLRLEVASLLAQETRSTFLDRPAWEMVTVGGKVGPYEILEPLGSGGMGTVYKARDARLKRFVAIKVLRADSVADPHQRARFIQEARAASALNHPNIVTVYDFVTEGASDCIVMEYVAGETLARKIGSPELSLPQSLKYAVQIAEALTRAHAAGIVHRDLKPANIMIAGDGTAKVLDFGLAKFDAAVRPAGESTASLPRTGRNMILGTIGYMSPEQVLGRELDHRSDLFSFGLVLYEMLAGCRAFPGDSAMEVMSAILNQEPPGLPDTVPVALRQIVAGCLEKDRAARFESARDLAFALRAFSAGSSSSAAAPGPETDPPRPRQRWLVPALGGAVVALLALLAAQYFTRTQPLDLSALKLTPLATDVEVEALASWSPEGKSVTYLKEVEGQRQVMHRNLDMPSPAQLTRLSAGVHKSAPFFSPDGERVYFIASEAVWSVALVGGEPRHVLSAPAQAAALSPDGKTLALWLMYKENGVGYAGVWISSPPGAPPRKYQPAPFRVIGGYAPNYLRFSPDGSQLGYAGWRVAGEPWMWILPWPDGPKARPHRIFSASSFPETPAFDWMPDLRHMCLSAEGHLWLGDIGTGKLRRLTASPIGVATEPSVSPGGGPIVFTADTTDFDAIEIPLDGSAPKTLIATARSETSPSWSAAGDQFAFITDRSGESEIWLRSTAAGWERPAVRQSDFRDDPGLPFISVTLSPDGTRIAYKRHWRLWVAAASGGRGSQAVSAGGLHSSPSWSPDGSSLAYLVAESGRTNLAIAQVGDRESQFLVPGTTSQCAAAVVWSPDGRWIACGAYDQTILLVSPDGRQRRKLPSPAPVTLDRFVLVWSRDAQTIYLASSDTIGSRLDALDLRTEKSRRIAVYPRGPVFHNPWVRALAGSLSKDGRSFATTGANRRSDLWILRGLSMSPATHSELW